MKHLYVAAGAVAVFLLWKRGQAKQKTSTQLQDTMASQKGSDWIGIGGMYDMWDRLSGADLKLRDYPNASGGVSADFSKVDRRTQAIMPAWDGTL